MQSPLITVSFSQLRSDLQTTLEKRFTEQEELTTVVWLLFSAAFREDER